jgi:hypothetical protein
LGGTGQSLGPVAPPITPLDFFWVGGGYVKDQIFRPKVGSVFLLRAGIDNADASVTPQMLGNIWRGIEHRLDILRATNGVHIEKY